MPQKPTTASEDTPDGRRSPRRWVRLALVAGLAVAAGLAGLWIVRLNTPDSGTLAVLPDLLRARGDADSRPPEGRTRGDLVRDPLGEVGIRPLTAEEAPDVVPPPVDAERTFAMKTPDGAVTVRYRGGVSLAQAADHYRTRLAAAGYQLLQDTPGAQGRRVMVFEKPQGTVEVALRNPDGKGKITSILVILRTR